jgi:hypothetical protein
VSSFLNGTELIRKGKEGDEFFFEGSKKKGPSLVKQFTHPTTSLFSATWYAFRIAASFAVILNSPFPHTRQTGFTEPRSPGHATE